MILKRSGVMELGTPCTSRFAFKQISVEDSTNVLNKMKTKNAAGPYKITSKLLRLQYTLYTSHCSIYLT